MKPLVYTILLSLMIAPGAGLAQVGSALDLALIEMVPAYEFSLDAAGDQSNSYVPDILPPFSLFGREVPKAYSYEDLGMFCKLEVQLEKKFRMPMKIRLGEVQYTEQLEYGKY